ncbi:MAG TPA: hypothetical protein VLS90_11225 [Thermodesulfobacteriota bacterium]|nr:hypothetical protein [Thermodesulfobacteriota bacterium]
MEEGIEKTTGGFFPLLGLPGFPAGKPVRTALIMGARPDGLTAYLSALAASLGFKVLVADAANSFDPYVVSKFARKEGIPPGDLLKKILVARAFTCHQLSTLIRERLESNIPPGAPALVIFLGPCTMFFDDDVPREEAALLFRKTMAKVQEISRAGVFFLLSQSFSGFNKKRSFFLHELVKFSDAVLKLKSSPDALQVVLDKPPLKLPRPWRVFEEFKRLAAGDDAAGEKL